MSSNQISFFLLSCFQVRFTDDGELEILLNGNITNLSNVNASSVDNNVDIRRTAVNAIQTTFSTGISVTVTLQSDILDFVATLPQSFMGRTLGLLGNFNGNDTDDFIYPDGTVLSNDAQDREIHSFGQSCKEFCPSFFLFFFLLSVLLFLLCVMSKL